MLKIAIGRSSMVTNLRVPGGSSPTEATTCFVMVCSDGLSYGRGVHLAPLAGRGRNSSQRVRANARPRWLEFRVRGSLRESISHRRCGSRPSPQPSPREERGEGADRARDLDLISSGNSVQLLRVAEIEGLAVGLGDARRQHARRLVEIPVRIIGREQKLVPADPLDQAEQMIAPLRSLP